MPSPLSRGRVGVDDVDADATTTDTGDQGAQRGRGATATADHLAEVLRVHVYLDGAATPSGDHLDANVVRIGDDAANEMFDGVGDDGAHSSAVRRRRAPRQPRLARSSASQSAASSRLLGGAFFFFGGGRRAGRRVVGRASAALNRSSLLGLGSLTFSVPSAPGRP